MKTKFILATFALVVELGFLYLTGWPSDSMNTPAVEQAATPPAAFTFTEPLTETPRPMDALAANEIAPPFYQALPGVASLPVVESRFETTDPSQFPTLLAELERMPESPVKDDMMREALTKWAALDGAAAATWAKLRGDSRRFLPPAVTEVDPTGAGDIFATAFFTRLLNTRDPWEAARFANRIAAISVTRPGMAGVPSPDEVRACLVEVLD